MYCDIVKQPVSIQINKYFFCEYFVCKFWLSDWLLYVSKFIYSLLHSNCL